MLWVLPDRRAVADAVWDELVTGHDGAGKAGAQLWTDLDAVLADTNELQGDWVNGGRLDLLLDGAASAGDPWLTEIPGAYGAGTAGLILGPTWQRCTEPPRRRLSTYSMTPTA